MQTTEQLILHYIGHISISTLTTTIYITNHYSNSTKGLVKILDTFDLFVSIKQYLQS